jgi:hypothetical protein
MMHMAGSANATQLSPLKLWKSFNSGGQQFYRYEQNEQSKTSFLKELNTTNTKTYYVGNRGPGLGYAQKGDGVRYV